MNHLLRSFLLGVAAFACLSANSAAQVERVLPRKGASSLEGTQFVVGFMQNEILEIGIDPRLQIFIASQHDAIVTIDYPQFGPRVVRVAANTVHIEGVTAEHMVTTSEIPERKAIFITSDKPVVVYVLNTLATSTDTYSAIPIRHLGTQYLSMNRPNDHYRLQMDSDPYDTATRSGEFMIMATENFTRVSITPRARTEMGYPANQEYSVTLNRGECFQVQSDHTPLGTGDLTGSRIDADRPIAVLSGHMRASAPTNLLLFKDHLIEMLPPISKWGKSYITTPFALVEGGDFIRVMAADYNTNIEIVVDGGAPIPLFLAAPGDWREFRVTDAALWRSDKPFFVAQFMPSSNGASSSYDPAMVVVPPLEVYIDAALFQFPTLERQNGQGGQQVFAYYINVAADSASLPTLSINKTLVTQLAPAITTQRVPGTNMHWAQIKLNPGVYTITAAEGVFSGVMYGTTHADSYANLFGVGYDPPAMGEHNPPLFLLAVNCGLIIGSVRDSALANPNLNEITVQTQRTFNYRWTITPPLNVAGTVDVDASIRDLWSDAQIVFHAYDDKGNGKEWLYYYDAPFVTVPITASITSLGNTTSCINVPIVNSDSTPATIIRVSLIGDSRLSLSGTPITDTVIQPGGTLFVRVCYDPTADTTAVLADLVVQYPCGLNHRCAVRVQGSASLNADVHDFGNVRVGDTVCALVPIYNDGTLPVPLDSLADGLGGTDFAVSSTIPSMPLMILPGDTVWVDVCFTPAALGSHSRTDTVVSGLVKGTIVKYLGRGIRPEIRDIHIDFKQRKVGTNTDTAFALSNTGEARCLVSFGRPSINEPAYAFGQPGLPASIDGGDFTAISLRFTPPIVGPFTDTIPMLTDWRFHEYVRLIIDGYGVLPRVNTLNIDFGDVVIDTSKDTTETLVRSNGNIGLKVYAVRVLSGPDSSSFTVPPSIIALRSLDVDSVLTDLVSFLPIRVGSHRCVIELEHDAIAGNQTATSTIILTGNGVPLPFTELEPKLIAPNVMPACVGTEVQIVIENLGTTVIEVDTVTLSIASTKYTFSETFPFEVAIGESRTLMVSVEPDRTSGTQIVAVVFYNDTFNVTLTHDFILDIQSPMVTSAASLDGAPGNVVSFDVSASSTQIRTSPEEFTVRVTADREKWAVKPETFSATVTDIAGQDLAASLIVTVMPDGAILTLDRLITSPYQVRFSVAGDVLWRDPADELIQFEVQETQCANASSSGSTLSMDLCAGGMRMVRFDALSLVTSRVQSNPLSSGLEIEFNSTHSTAIDLSILTQTGQRISIAYNYPLQKGVTNCNFSTSAWASGLVWLFVQHENGEYVVPVLFVK